MNGIATGLRRMAKIVSQKSITKTFIKMDDDWHNQIAKPVAIVGLSSPRLDKLETKKKRKRK